MKGPPGRAANMLFVRCDVSSEPSVRACVRQVVKRFGRLDALVNNAATFYQTPIGEISAEDWENLIGADLRAPLFIAQAAAPALKKTQGAIVNITDIHAERPLKNYVIYSIAKTGLVGLTRD